MDYLIWRVFNNELFPVVFTGIGNRILCIICGFILDGAGESLGAQDKALDLPEPPEVFLGNKFVEEYIWDVFTAGKEINNIIKGKILLAFWCLRY